MFVIKLSLSLSLSRSLSLSLLFLSSLSGDRTIATIDEVKEGGAVELIVGEGLQVLKNKKKSSRGLFAM